MIVSIVQFAFETSSDIALFMDMIFSKSLFVFAANFSMVLHSKDIRDTPEIPTIEEVRQGELYNGLSNDGQYLNHLRFTDCIVLIANNE